MAGALPDARLAGDRFRKVSNRGPDASPDVSRIRLRGALFAAGRGEGMHAPVAAKWEVDVGRIRRFRIRGREGRGTPAGSRSTHDRNELNENPEPFAQAARGTGETSNEDVLRGRSMVGLTARERTVRCRRRPLPPEFK